MTEVDMSYSKYYDPKTFIGQHKENQRILKKLNITSETVFIDIGAHRGEEINFLQNFGCEVHSFECNPYHYENLVKIYGKNSNIIFNNFIVTNSDGELKKCYYKKTSKIASMSEEPSKKNNSAEYIYVKTIRLSTYIKDKNLVKIDILKIDAEGSEFKIIEDLIETGMIDRIDNILYEDHAEKMKSSSWKSHRKKVLKQMALSKTKFMEWL